MGSAEGRDLPAWQTAPGIYPEVSESEYRTPERLTRSVLEAYHSGDSLAQIHEDLTHPEPPTEAMQIGTAVHLAVLQPDLFAAKVAGAPECDRRTTAGKATWADFQAEHAGKSLLKAEAFAAVGCMAAAIQAHPFGRAFLPRITHRELLVVGRHDAAVCLAYGRIDAVVATDEVILDIKTIASANRHFRQRRIVDAGLHRQGAFYCRLASDAGLPAKHYVVFFVQSKPPWEVVPVRLPEVDLQLGWREMERAWLAVDADWSAGRYPGHAEDLLEEGLPEWYQRRELRTDLGLWA